MTNADRLNKTARRLGILNKSVPDNMLATEFIEIVSLILEELARRGLAGDWSHELEDDE